MEFILVALVILLLASWALGFGASFFGVLFTGFFAGLLFLGGGFFVKNGKVLHGMIALLAGFIVVGALGAGWIHF